MGSLRSRLRSESGQVGSTGVLATAIPTAVLGTKVGVLPATGVAIGLYVLIAMLCITAGVVLRWQSARLARRAA